MKDILIIRFSKIYLDAQETKTVKFTIHATDLQYVGVDGWYIYCIFYTKLKFELRNLLESGEVRVAIGHETDCRASADGCGVFSLQTSANYNPVCDYACNLWTSGVLCGKTTSLSSCQNTCKKNLWTWNYVGCLEDYATGIYFTFSK